MNGLLTEREWRKQYLSQSKARPMWWGAQYLLAPKPQNTLRDDRAFRAFLLLLSLIISILLPHFFPAKEKSDFEEVQAAVVQSVVQPRSVQAISYTAPSGIQWKEYIFTCSELARGKMLMLDFLHPLPADLPPPNTFSIAAYGKGMIPVSSLRLQSGQETIQALQELFAALRQKGVNGLMVHQGTLSAAQQQAIRLEKLRKLLRSLTPAQAVTRILQETDRPSTGEMLREYTVELRFQQRDGIGPDERRLEEFPNGQTLLQTAWRYGFIRTAPQDTGDRAYRFRYVGKAHAMAMTFLDLSFEDYLLWLHEKGTLSISEGGQIRYLILCKPMKDERIVFQLPQNASYEASLDNLGYAIIACEL